jgi:abortive infection alpha-like protein
MPISDEQAKLGQELVKALRELGSFFGRALGNTPEHLIGYLFGDRLQIRRAENFINMLMETKARLEYWGVEQPKAASLSVAIPICQAAADEDRDELVDLWSRLLANAMDPKLRSVRYSFIEAVKAMDPLDASTVGYLYRQNVQSIRLGAGGDNINASFEKIAQ